MFKANEQNVFKIEHTFEWIDLIDLKIRTATNYNRIAKKFKGKLYLVPSIKKDA